MKQKTFKPFTNSYKILQMMSLAERSNTEIKAEGLKDKNGQTLCRSSLGVYVHNHQHGFKNCTFYTRTVEGHVYIGQVKTPPFDDIV
jgi:hypothetical protein